MADGVIEPMSRLDTSSNELNGIPVLLAPNESQWYHGRLDRNESETRLNDAPNSLGSYLIRESERKPGSYVLSFLGKTGINHFRVTAVCGDFYIGGRQFESLQDLIGYYTFKSDLLKNERLLHPIAPMEPVNDDRKMVAILPYSKLPDTDELSFEKGDIFFIHNEMQDGWLWATAHKSGVQGLIFKDLLSPINNNDDDITSDPNCVFLWFHTNITKEEAVDMLVKAGSGSYLVRPSDNSPGDYSLFFHIPNQIQRFRIEKKSGGMRYVMGGRSFNCLQAVIDRYKTEEIYEGYTLSHFVKKIGFETVNGHLSSEIQRLNGVPIQQSAADKIYASLRECRELAEPTKMKGVKMQGYLSSHKMLCTDKKSSFHKLLSTMTSASLGSWKQLFFVLKDNGLDDIHLYFYDNPKRTKPKGLIDLSCAYVYEIDESLLERRFVLQVVEKALPCLATVTYLACSDASEYADWLDQLRTFCVCQKPQANILSNHGIKEIRNVSVTLVETNLSPSKSLSSASNNNNSFISFSITFNNSASVLVGRSKLKPFSHSIIIDESFHFSDIPSDISSLTFNMSTCNKSGMIRSGSSSSGKEQHDVCSASLPFSALVIQNSKVSSSKSDEWTKLTIPLCGMNFKDEWGHLMLNVKYENLLILPLQEYSSLKLLLMDPTFEVLKVLVDVCCDDDINSHEMQRVFANSLLRLYRFEEKESELLTTFNKVEIEKESEGGSLFSPTNSSFASILMESYLRDQGVCDDFITSAILPTITSVLESSSFRSSSSVSDSSSSVSHSTSITSQSLVQLLSDIIESIFMSSEACPRTLRYIFWCLQMEVSHKWPNDRLLKTRVITAFIFVRLLCPAIREPNKFNLKTNLYQISQNAKKTLTILASNLAQLANISDTTTSESGDPLTTSSELVNTFISKNKERMIVFIDHLSSIREKPFPDEERVRGDESIDLAIIHKCISSALHSSFSTKSQKLHSLAKDQPSLKNLVTVTDMLTRHKNKYLEMVNSNNSLRSSVSQQNNNSNSNVVILNHHNLQLSNSRFV